MSTVATKQPPMTKKGDVATGLYVVKRHHSGIMSGPYGRLVFYLGNGNQCDGLNPEDLLDAALGDGAHIEVTVRVLHPGRLKPNPWLKNRR